MIRRHHHHEPEFLDAAGLRVIVARLETILVIAGALHAALFVEVVLLVYLRVTAP